MYNLACSISSIVAVVILTYYVWRKHRKEPVAIKPVNHSKDLGAALPASVSSPAALQFDCPDFSSMDRAGLVAYLHRLLAGEVNGKTWFGDGGIFRDRSGGRFSVFHSNDVCIVVVSINLGWAWRIIYNKTTMSVLGYSEQREGCSSVNNADIAGRQAKAVDTNGARVVSAEDLRVVLTKLMGAYRTRTRI